MSQEIGTTEDVPIPSWGDIDPNARNAPPAGQPLPDEYMALLDRQRVKFVNHLGSGAFGTVWSATISRAECQNVSVDIVVAVKVMSLHMLHPRPLIEATIKIIREVDVIKELDHPHVVKLVRLMILEDINATAVSFPYMHVLLFMELCDEDLLKFLIRINREMYEIEIYHWFVQMADALRYLHYDRRVAHMDIKPPNMLIKHHPTLANHFLFKLTDFGLSLTFDEGEFTAKSRAQLGTGVYMAPEVASRRLFGYDALIADIYSLGVTVVDSIVGYSDQLRSEVIYLINVCLNDPITYPQIDEHEAATRIRMSDSLVNLLRGMLAPDPSRRFDINRVYFHDWTSQLPYASGRYLQFWP